MAAPSSSEYVDNERLIGDSNKLSLLRGRKRVPEGNGCVSVFISTPARASGLSGGGGGGSVGAAAIVSLGCAFLLGRTF